MKPRKTKYGMGLFDMFGTKRAELQIKATEATTRQIEAQRQFYATIINDVNAWRIDMDAGNLQVRDYIFRLYNDPRNANHVVAAIVRQLSEAIGEMAQYIEVLGSDEKELPNHWAKALLDAPSYGVSRSMLFEQLAVNYLLQGEAFLVGMDKAVSLGRAPFYALFCIPSHIVDIKRTGAVSPPSYVVRNGFNAYMGGDVPPMNEKNTAHIKSTNLDPNTLHGLSPLVGVLEQVATIEAIVKRSNMIVRNGGVVNLITPRPDSIGVPTQQQKDDVKAAIRYNNGSKATEFFDAAIEMHRIGDNPNEMGVFGLWDKAEQTTANAYGYPLDLLKGGATFNNIAESKKQKYQIAIPILNRLTESIAAFLGLTKDGATLSLNTDKIEVLQPEPEKVLAAMALAGTTTNERRNYMGFEPIKEPQADMVQYPMNTAFMGEDMPDTNENKP